MTDQVLERYLVRIAELRQSMREAAEKMGMGLLDYLAFLNARAKALDQWHKDLRALGWQPGDDPISFLQRINRQRN